MASTFFGEEKYFEFIEEFENSWLQYASADQKMKAYFGSEDAAIQLFKKWNNGEDIWELRKNVSWNLDKRSNKN